MAAISYILLLISLSSSVYYINGASVNINDQGDFNDFVEYVSKNINFTLNYALPENNSYLVENDDSTIHDYGTFDFIIVGGGSAGTLLAKRLAEIKQWKILLLEAGHHETPFTDIPFMNAYTRNSPYNFGYKTVPQKNACQGMVDKRCVFPTGKGLGGSGIIGDMVYARGNSKDYDEWVSMGLKDWSYEKVLPYFKKTEGLQATGQEEEYHGKDGPLLVNYTYPNPPNYEQYLEASNLAGLKSIDINGKHQIGISKFLWTIDFNRRLTGGNTFILPIINSTNLNVSLHSYATKIIFDGNEAKGVQFVKNKKIYTATASKEVILSAGPINSAQLLMLSGVGPKDHLNDLGIEVVKDLPVGEHFMDHPVFAGLYIRTNQSVTANSLEENLRLWTQGKAPFTTIFTAENIAFFNSKDLQVEPPNIETLSINHPNSVPSATFYNLNEDYAKSFTTYNASSDFVIYVILLDPKSRGTVRLASKNPADFCLIDPNYYSDKNNEDIEAIYNATQFVLKLINQKPLQSIGAHVVSTFPGCKGTDKEYAMCAIKHMSSTLYHPAGSTRMGVNEKDSVVDGELKVHGLNHLRVVDAGVMPKIVRGHLISAVFMIAEKAADYIKATHGAI